MIAQDTVSGLPAGWRKLPVKYCLRPGQDGSRIGPFGSALKLEDLADRGIPVFGQGNVMAGDYTFGKKFLTEVRFSELRQYATRPGDVLITMMGSAGRCDVVPEDAPIGIVDSHLLRLRLNAERVDPRFFRWFLDEAAPAKAQSELIAGTADEVSEARAANQRNALHSSTRRWLRTRRGRRPARLCFPDLINLAEGRQVV